jgi:outer membrane protein TolC
MLPWKGTLDARSTAAGFSERIAENQLERTSIDMAYRIKLDYLDLYRARRSVAIAKKQQEWLNNLRSLARSRLESSAGNLAALTQIDLKIRELDWKMGQFFREAEIQVQAINQWRNRPGDTPVLTPEVLDPAELPIPGEEIPERHPELRDAELRQLQSDARVAVIQLERKPSFGVGLDYIVVGSRTDMDMPRNGRDILSPRVNIRIPLYAEVYNARIAEQQLRKEALELSKSDAYNKLEQAAAQSLLQWESAVEELDWIGSHLEGLNQLIRLKITAWESGQGSFDDILNLYLEQENFSWRALQAELRAHQAKAARERALGMVY